MSDLLDDATSAYNAYREATPGSYLETALANDICRDIVPALISRLQRPIQPLGFTNEKTTELESDTERGDDE